LKDEVCKAANAFTNLGIRAGDRVAIYMPMVPEAIITMLACARLGATHSVVFAGFSAAALRSRVDDAEAKLVVTTDGQYRRGQPAPLKTAVDEALGNGDDAAPSVKHVLVGPGPRRVVGRHRRRGVARARGAGVRLQPPAVPAVHVGHHGQA
jgi:acetyl-CoA synthetase